MISRGKIGGGGGGGEEESDEKQNGSLRSSSGLEAKKKIIHLTKII